MSRDIELTSSFSLVALRPCGSNQIDSYGLIRISQQCGECTSHLVIGNLSAKRAERRVLRRGHDASRGVLRCDNVQARTVGKGTQVLDLFAVLEAEDLQRGDELQPFDACIRRLGANEDEPP
jgi:hypothetical protein